MPTIRVEAQVSDEDLLRAVEQLSQPEFHRFVANVLALRVRRGAPQESSPETELLLLRLNQGPPEDLRRRYDALVAKRRAEALTPAEHSELIDLSDELERRDAEWLAALVALAKLRGVTLADLMHQLGLAAHG